MTSQVRFQIKEHTWLRIAIRLGKVEIPICLFHLCLLQLVS